MALVWDKTGERLYETGTDRGALYPQTGENGAYAEGVAWNGLTKVTESPDGAEETGLYADNGKYLSLYSTENFKGTIGAYMYPDEFAACDGSAQVATGVYIGQQTRVPFGFTYRTFKGNDTKETDYGYKLHLVWAAKVSPSERAYEGINQTPSAVTFSWGFTTTPTFVDDNHKPTASMTIDSTTADPAALKRLEDTLYGAGAEGKATLPSPAEVIAIFKTGSGTPASGTQTSGTPASGSQG